MEKEMEVLKTIAQALYEKKGANILAIDVREISSLTEYFIIAEGSVERHVQALSRDIKEVVESLDYPIFHLDGDTNGDWIVLDCGKILIHLFVPEMREKYQLEELWHDGKVVDLDIKVSS